MKPKGTGARGTRLSKDERDEVAGRAGDHETYGIHRWWNRAEAAWED